MHAIRLKPRTSPRLARAAALAALAALPGCAGHGPHKGNLFNEGRRVFVSAGCGACHAVASAHTHGRIGPDFDVSEQLSRSQILRQLRSGEGVMPSYQGRLRPDQERAVAEFVFQTMRQRSAAPRSVLVKPRR